MRKLVIVFVVTVCFSNLNFAQTSASTQAPEVVKEAFDQKYPDAKNAVWKNYNGKWEADFSISEQVYEVTYTQAGKWMRTDQELTVDEIPSEITSALEVEFSGFTVEQVEIFETPKGKFYELRLLVGQKELNVVTNLDGKVIKKDAGQNDN